VTHPPSLRVASIAPLRDARQFHRIFNLTDIPAPSFSTRRGGCRTAALRR
jgi:hypothetical protein